MFLPVFYAKSNTAKIIIYTYYLLIISNLCISFFEEIFALSKIVYTDKYLLGSNVPHYSILSPSQLAKSKIYSFDYFVLKTEILRLFFYPFLILGGIIGFKRPSTYGFLKIAHIFLAGFETFKAAYFGLSMLACAQFFFCIPRDTSWNGTPLPIEMLCIFTTSVYFAINNIVIFAILTFFQQVSRSLQVEEEKNGSIPFEGKFGIFKRSSSGIHVSEKKVIDHPQNIIEAIDTHAYLSRKLRKKKTLNF